MNIGEMNPGKFFNAAQVEDPKTLTIAKIEMQTFEEDGIEKSKGVAFFEEDERGVVLNVTRKEDIADLYGPETDAWIGKQITLYQGETFFSGKKIACVSVKKAEAPF